MKGASCQARGASATRRRLEEDTVAIEQRRGKPEAVPFSDRKHAIDLGQRDVVADPAVARLTFKRQQYRLGHAGELYSVGQTL